MCVSLPGLIVSISGQMAKVEINGQTKEVFMAVSEAAAGDFVLIYGNAVIAVIDEREAAESARLISQLQEAAFRQKS